MKIKYDVPISQISWLKSSYAGVETGKIGVFYEPENVEELKNLVLSLYAQRRSFDVIGYTSNIYYRVGYNVETMISTRLCKTYRIIGDKVVCDCGVGVAPLARKMVADGIEGFAGLADLPGTVAAAVYGNAGCYGCSVNNLLDSFELLCLDGGGENDENQ